MFFDRIIENQLNSKDRDKDKYKFKNIKNTEDNSKPVVEASVNRSKKTLKIGLYSVDSSYEISLISILMLDKLYNKYKNKCLYICNKPFSLLKKTYFGHISAYVDKDDMKKLAKLLFYMDSSKEF